ncbi:high nitrogen upregulated cytochrome P450 monooxygenase 2 [Mycena amicta]|nr:high nitrogen upregulated cytochrome P450 monooxygenase 2 [Mycena amicta]
MDQTLFLAVTLLGIATHVFFNRYELRSANTAIPILVFLPPTLLFFLGYPARGPLSLATLTCTYLVFLTSLSASIVAYRLSPFHPLAEYPGPTLSKATKLWTLGLSAGGHQYLYLKKLHDKYGPYVRTGPNELSVIDVRAVVQILSSGGLEKGRYFEGGRHASTPPTIVSLVGDAHTAKRRVWNRGMTASAIRDYDPLLAKRARQLIDHLDSQGARPDPVDLVFWFDLFALDLMGDLCFGGGFELMKEGKDKELIGDRIRSFMKASTMSGKIPWIVSTLHLFPQVGRTIQEFNDFGQALAMHRMKNGPPSGAKDLWYHLADEAGLEKERPTLESSAADGIVAVVAASDTTASAMSSLVWFLLNHPKAYQRIQEELDRVFPDGDNTDAFCDFGKQQELEFLSACINETLRLHPPLPSNGGPRQVHLGQKERVIAGMVIPPGTSIYTPTYVVHRSPEYFFQPDTFIPERWLSCNANSSLGAHNTGAFMPFSLGPANCVGQKFARHEMLLVLTLLFKTFDVAFADGFADKDEWANGRQEFFVSTRGPMRIKLTKRA